MLIVIVTTFIIWLPSFTIDISPNGYIQWVINAVPVGIFACVVVVLISIIFDRGALKGVFKRVLSVVKR